VLTYSMLRSYGDPTQLCDPLEDLGNYISRFSDLLEIRNAIDARENVFMRVWADDVAVLDLCLTDLDHLRDFISPQNRGNCLGTGEYGRGQVNAVLKANGLML